MVANIASQLKKKEMKFIGQIWKETNLFISLELRIEQKTLLFSYKIIQKTNHLHTLDYVQCASPFFSCAHFEIKSIEWRLLLNCYCFLLLLLLLCAHNKIMIYDVVTAYYRPGTGEIEFLWWCCHCWLAFSYTANSLAFVSNFSAIDCCFCY